MLYRAIDSPPFYFLNLVGYGFLVSVRKNHAEKYIKNTIIWTLLTLHLLALNKGLIKSIAAPVVPIHDAKNVPNPKSIKFNFGVPTKLPFKQIPPDTVNKANNKKMKGIYSNVNVCSKTSNTTLKL